MCNKFLPSSTLALARAWLLSVHGVLSGLLAAFLWISLTDDRLAAPQWGVRLFATLAFSFLTLNLLAYVCVEAAGTGRQRTRACLGGLLILLFSLFAGYHDKVGTSLDFGVVADNLAESLSTESLRVIFNSFKWKVVVLMGSVGLAHVVFRWRMASTAPDTVPPRRLGRLAYVAGVYVLAVLLPIDTYDDLTYFLKSAFASPYVNAPAPPKYKPGTYPLWQDRFPLSDLTGVVNDPNVTATPNVLLIVIESFNAEFVEKAMPMGQEYTPVFNRLIHRGVFVERFYANSVQTCKGHFAILFSLFPSLRGKAFRLFSDVRFLSLAEILRRRGYETIYFQGYGDLDFDDTRSFLSKNGFSAIRRAQDYLSAPEKQEVWGWGPEDRQVYEGFFRYADQNRLFEPGAKPVFAMVATIANHMRFDEVPPAKRQLYPEPQSIRQAYANSLRLSDEQLGYLIDELKKRQLLDDTIVIITSDHAFPVGEHGLTHAEAAFYEEAYRIPLLVLWGNRLKPRRIEMGAFSQVDIAPTLLDLLRVGDVHHHFVGSSIFADPKDHNAFLIQPYGGRHIGVVRPPYKYFLQLRTGEEWLVDLDADPEEAVNLVAEKAPLVEAMRRQLAAVMLNQKLLERGEICPEDRGSRSLSDLAVHSDPSGSGPAEPMPAAGLTAGRAPAGP
ncbi:MAG: sulfatase-like hydrolase/transferase [Candidatus Binatia bacterium]|jgi:arylsulfatase A-like enzyme